MGRAQGRQERRRRCDRCGRLVDTIYTHYDRRRWNLCRTCSQQVQLPLTGDHPATTSGIVVW